MKGEPRVKELKCETVIEVEGGGGLAVLGWAKGGSCASLGRWSGKLGRVIKIIKWDSECRVINTAPG